VYSTIPLIPDLGFRIAEVPISDLGLRIDKDRCFSLSSIRIPQSAKSAIRNPKSQIFPYSSDAPGGGSGGKGSSSGAWAANGSSGGVGGKRLTFGRYRGIPGRQLIRDREDERAQELVRPRDAVVAEELRDACDPG